MRLIIDVNKEKIIETWNLYIINSIKFLYGWFTTDGEILGYILAVFHVMFSAGVILMIILSHTVYPNFYFQLITFICLFIVWSHHVLLNVCIYVVAEKNLTQSISPYHELLHKILKSYNISIDEFVRYFMITETVGVGCFALEIVSRCFHYLFKYLYN